MKISIMCNDPEHPVNATLQLWMERHANEHEIEIIRNKNELSGGDILFLISCWTIISEAERSLYKASLVLHASDLPLGRGWSPHIWEIASGADHITVTLLEAEDRVDTGRIWRKSRTEIPRNALWDEINHLLFTAEIELMDFALENIYSIRPEMQPLSVAGSYHRKRSPLDSRLDPYKTIAEQFDLIRVCDPQRYPAFLVYRGQRYSLELVKLNEK